VAIDLSRKFQGFNGTLTAAEEMNFKFLLAFAAAGMAPGCAKPRGELNAVAFDTVSDTLVRLKPYSGRVSRNGIAYRGRAEMMTDELLTALLTEARALRPPSATGSDAVSLGCGAPIARELAVSSKLSSFVREHAGPVEPTGIANFIYYDQPGQSADPHVDTDLFAVNALVTLEHEYVTEPRAALVLFPPHSEPERFELVPGEVIIMFAASCVHGLEDIRPGERISLVTFGFQPLGT